MNIKDKKRELALYRIQQADESLEAEPIFGLGEEVNRFCQEIPGK